MKNKFALLLVEKETKTALWMSPKAQGNFIRAKSLSLNGSPPGEMLNACLPQAGWWLGLF